MTSKKTELGNGKNEEPRTNPTQSNYPVGNSTSAADNFRPSAQSSKELTKAGG